jgi:hypothetical protein
MPLASQILGLVDFVKSANTGNLVLDVTDTEQDVAVPAGHDLVLFVPRPPNPGETVPGLRIGKAATAHADNLPISGFYPTLVTVGSEGQDISISSTAAWSVEVFFGKTESGLAT